MIVVLNYYSVYSLYSLYEMFVCNYDCFSFQMIFIENDIVSTIIDDKFFGNNFHFYLLFCVIEKQ